jgi:putative oxidoreductase
VFRRGALTLDQTNAGETIMDNLRKYAVPLGRLLLAALFIWAGFGKLTNPSGTAQYFAHANIPIPSVTVWIVIIVELIGGLAILVGFWTRWAALILAIFCVITGLAVHLPAGDQANLIHVFKNLSIAGGFLYVFAFGAGIWSIDGPEK